MESAKNLRVLVLVSLFALSAFIGCGIDEYVYLEPVSNVLNNPTDSPDAAYRFFSFVTKDETNQAEAGGYFQGWEIYYRIYNSKSDRSADTTDIATKADADPANAFYYVNTTKKYRRMTFIRGDDTSSLASAPLIGASSSDRTITIRPVSTGDSYPAEFLIDETQVFGSDGTALLAWREESDVSAKSFDYEEIDTGDTDVKYNSGASVGTDAWFLQAYVFAYGFDTSYKAIYSELLSLGSITIEP